MIPLVSIIITTFNHSKFIKECVDSVLQDKYENLEIIIADSASTDNTLDLIKEYDDRRIKIIALERNLGPSYVANEGIKGSSGEYIALLSGDDVSMPSRITEQMNYVQSDFECSIVFSHPIIINEKSDVINRHFFNKVFKVGSLNKIELLRKFFYEGNFLCAPSVLMKKEVIEKIGLFDERLVRLQDYDYWIRAVIAGYKIAVLPQALVKYRIHGNNLNTQDQWLSLIDKRFVLKHFLSISREDALEIFSNSDYSFLNESVNQVMIIVALAALESKNHSTMEFGINLLFDMQCDAVCKKELEDRGIYLFELLRRYAMNRPKSYLVCFAVKLIEKFRFYANC